MKFTLKNVLLLISPIAIPAFLFYMMYAHPMWLAFVIFSIVICTLLSVLGIMGYQLVQRWGDK